MSGYYPPGADTPDAPWNQEDLPEKEIDVLVSVTLSKTVKVKVNDYTVDEGIDEEGNYFKVEDFSGCDLRKAVEDQIILPQNADMFVNTHTCYGHKAYRDLIDWNVDEMECILDN